VLSPKIEEGADPNSEWQIIATVAGQLADEGFDVQVPREINLKLAPELRACSAADCAKSVKQVLGVDYVLAIKVFHMGSGDSLSLALIDAAGSTYTGRSSITASTSANQAAAQALWQALDAQRRGPGPWLLVQGEPSGAKVTVNGKPAGTLPRAQSTVQAGENTLEVSAEGYEPQRETRTFSNDADEMQEVDVHLHRIGEPADVTGSGGGGGAHGDSIHAPASALWNDVAGWTSIGVGALLLVKPVLSVAKSGDCAERAGGRCVRSQRFTSTATWHTIGGLAFAGFGVTVLVLKPFAVHADVSSEHVALDAVGSF
jgi:hypothetical protein